MKGEEDCRQSLQKYFDLLTVRWKNQLGIQEGTEKSQEGKKRDNSLVEKENAMSYWTKWLSLTKEDEVFK